MILAAFLLVARARFLMGTICEINAANESQIAAAFDEAARIEKMISTWRSDSELSTGRYSPELVSLIQNVEQWRDKTGGAFEPRIRPLIDAWKTRGEGAVPDAKTIANALADIRSGKAMIEEGGFGKGYALDWMLTKIDGDAVLNFGGQILVRGTAPVTIADPLHRHRAVVALTIHDASLSTSSGSEKSFVVNGRRFTHIFDPRTGDALPPRGSVSVIANTATEADILSTALYVMGRDEGLRWANEHAVAALFIDGIIVASETFPGFSVIPSERSESRKPLANTQRIPPLAALGRDDTLERNH
jgi:thiamine biosynthesis lipoprotein